MPEAKKDDAVVKQVRARVLVDGAFGKPNDVVTVDEDVAKRNSHELDTEPAALVQADKERAAFERRQAMWRGDAPKEEAV